MFLHINPLSELNRIRREMNELVENEWTGPAPRSFPLVNIYEDADAITVIAELPGLDASAISLSVHDGLLSIQGTRVGHQLSATAHALRKERPEGEFEKSVRIPVKVQADLINARFKDGLLTVTLPKAEEAKPRPITINVA